MVVAVERWDTDKAIPHGLGSEVPDGETPPKSKILCFATPQSDDAPEPPRCLHLISTGDSLPVIISGEGGWGSRWGHRQKPTVVLTYLQNFYLTNTLLDSLKDTYI